MGMVVLADASDQSNDTDIDGVHVQL